MNRPIKFRFWSKILDKFVIPNDDIFVGALKDPDMVVMQFTGLHDKTGKEIYESDIVKVLEIPYKVIWNQDLWAFDRDDHYLPFTTHSPTTMQLLDLEVIGNIYEHKHLLEVQVEPTK